MGVAKIMKKKVNTGVIFITLKLIWALFYSHQVDLNLRYSKTSIIMVYLG